jgi:hypothetical protein
MGKDATLVASLARPNSRRSLPKHTAVRLQLTWGSAPHPGSVARGGPTPRSALSRARRARLTTRPDSRLHVHALAN